MATDIKEDARLKFQRHGWHFRAPHNLSADYWLYRDYIRRSKGEFTVAKDQYVRLNTAWFSDRSGCYLAAGRPVICRRPALAEFLGTGSGLFAFRSLDEVAEAVTMINADYARQARAARENCVGIFRSLWRRS